MKTLLLDQLMSIVQFAEKINTLSLNEALEWLSAHAPVATLLLGAFIVLVFSIEEGLHSLTSALLAATLWT